MLCVHDLGLAVIDDSLLPVNFQLVLTLCSLLLPLQLADAALQCLDLGEEPLVVEVIAFELEDLSLEVDDEEVLLLAGELL